MSQLPIFEHFLSVGNLKPKLKWVFKSELKPKYNSIELHPRSFNGAALTKKSVEETFGAKSCGRDGAVVDLEDCCHMTLCETPCVEATIRKTSNRRNRRKNPSVSIISSPTKSNSDADRDGLIENEVISDNDMNS